MSEENSNSGQETVYCIECGEEISSNTAFCPECGSEQDIGVEEGERSGSDEAESEGLRYKFPGISKGNTTRRNVLIGTGYSILGLGVLGAAAGDEDNNTERTGGDTGPTNGDSGGGEEEEYPNAWYVHDPTGIVIHDVEASAGQFSLTIEGEATNESGSDYSYVQITFEVLDSSDTKLGDALANTSGLDAGQRWRFEALGTSVENADSFRLGDVTAY